MNKRRKWEESERGAIKQEWGRGTCGDIEEVVQNDRKREQQREGGRD